MLVPHLSPTSAQSIRQRVGIFGSTGSIGRSALEIIRENPDRFEVSFLVAGSNVELLAAQAREFSAKIIGIADATRHAELVGLVGDGPCHIVAGAAECAELGRDNGTDTVLAAVVGIAGLRSVFEALEAGKTVALANKESLVCAGELVSRVQAISGARLLPVDSEHSALFQALAGSPSRDISRLILTASGGPFLRTPMATLENVTVKEALNHPRWSMGPKITIDSSTMFNKALEVIEAYWLFGVPIDQIDVVVHPQSIIHSTVEFVDGGQIAQLSHPDMRGPISYALGFPSSRVAGAVKPLQLAEVGTLEFLPLDNAKFPAVSLARSAVKRGGALPAVFNLLNEIAVERFLRGGCRYLDIFRFVDAELGRFEGRQYGSLEELLALEVEVRGVYG